MIHEMMLYILYVSQGCLHRGIHHLIIKAKKNIKMYFIQELYASLYSQYLHLPMPSQHIYISHNISIITLKLKKKCMKNLTYPAYTFIHIMALCSTYACITQKNTNYKRFLLTIPDMSLT